MITRKSKKKNVILIWIFKLIVVTYFFIYVNRSKKRKRKRISDDEAPPKKRYFKNIKTFVPTTPSEEEEFYNFSCAACPARFRKLKQLRFHLRQEHPGFYQFQCTICNNKFESQRALDAHMIVRHETEDKLFFCRKCEKGFSLEINFKSHADRHKIDKSHPVVCKVCDVRFVDEPHLEKHKSVHVNRFVCEFCGSEVSTSAALRR